jgi:acetyl esterase/lipase
MGSKGSYRKILPELAANGFVAASIQYRLAPAGRFPAQVEDTLEAIRFLRANAAKWNIDGSRVVVLGASAGAHLALLAGFASAGTRDAVQAIVNISAPIDLRDWKMTEEADRALQKTTGKSSETLIVELLGTSDRGAQIVRDASPLLQVRQNVPPVLTFHWKDDRAVVAEQAERLVTALEKSEVPHETVWFEGRGHALMGAGVETIVPRTVAFLNRLFGKR